MTIAVIFSFLSNNPEMSFVTKDHFIWGCYFLIVFTGAYIYLNAKIRYRCHYYAFLSSHYYHFFLLIIFQGIKIFFFIDSNSLREWYGFAIGAAFSGGVVGFYPIMEIVFGVVLAVPWPQYWDYNNVSKFRLHY
jgi:hypothetical protein